MLATSETCVHTCRLIITLTFRLIHASVTFDPSDNHLSFATTSATILK